MPRLLFVMVIHPGILFYRSNAGFGAPLCFHTTGW
jgi:hypothetical protein